jgi:hypothetical protein
MISNRKGSPLKYWNSDLHNWGARLNEKDPIWSTQHLVHDHSSETLSKEVNPCSETALNWPRTDPVDWSSVESDTENLADIYSWNELLNVQEDNDDVKDDFNDHNLVFGSVDNMTNNFRQNAFDTTSTSRCDYLSLEKNVHTLVRFDFALKVYNSIMCGDICQHQDVNEYYKGYATEVHPDLLLTNVSYTFRNTTIVTTTNTSHRRIAYENQPITPRRFMPLNIQMSPFYKPMILSQPMGFVSKNTLNDVSIKNVAIVFKIIA